MSDKKERKRRGEEGEKKKKEEDYEKVYMFGRKQDNPQLYFKNAELLRFKESHSGAKSRIGHIALKRAIYDIFDKVKHKDTRGKCHDLFLPSSLWVATQ